MLAALAAAGAVAAAPAHARPEPPPIHSDISEPFTASVYVDELGEQVTISGDLHISSDLHRGVDASTVDLYANLADAFATCNDSGDTYMATGADASTITLPPNPIRVSWTPTFS